MTVRTNVTEQLDKGVSPDVYKLLHDILIRQQDGEKIILKERTVKSGSYLQVYEYDKYSWRYVLTNKIKVR